MRAASSRHATHPDKAERNAAAAAAAMNEITAAGGAVGFARLEMLLREGRRQGDRHRDAVRRGSCW